MNSQKGRREEMMGMISFNHANVPKYTKKMRWINQTWMDRASWARMVVIGLREFSS